MNGPGATRLIPRVPDNRPPSVGQAARNRRLTARAIMSARERLRRRQRQADYEAHRPSSTKRGYDRRWRATRDSVLAHQPECAWCGRRGATEVDHIIPHRGRSDRFHDRDNLQPLCRECHAEKTRMGQ